jgi:putative MATE family efflux protein
VSLFKSREEFDLTSGGIAKPLFYLSLPIVVTNLLRTAYNVADAIWLGQYSTPALAAISFGFPMIFLLISLGMGISIAGSVLVAQNIGAGDERRAEYAASQTITMTVIASAILGTAGYFLVDDVLRLLGASDTVLPLATAYMRIISLGIVTMFGFAVFISLMRGYGDTVTPMLVMFGSVVLNIALDPVLIFGWTVGPVSFPEMGIRGAAVATVFSRGLAFAVGLAILFRGERGVEIHLGDMWPDPAFVSKMFAIGAPASVEVTSRAVSINALLFIIGTFATPVVAAFGIGTRIFSVIFLPAIAVAQGVETMSGQNIGAGKPDRVRAANYFAAKSMFAILSVTALLCFLFARPLVSLFTSDPPVLEAGVTFVRYVAPTFGFIGIMRSFSGGFRGTGHTLVAAAISIIMLAVVRLPAAWVGADLVGPEGIWYAFAVSNVAGALVAWLWFRRGTWREGDVTDPGTEGADAGVADESASD